MFTVSEQGWGVAKRKDIYAVLNSVRSVFSPCFQHDPSSDHLFVGYGPENPVSYASHGVILLNAEDCYWCQYAYQFAHEYCHFLIGGNVPHQLRWFEESLCELASYFFLPRITVQWVNTPPYPNWASYAPNFIKYVEKAKLKATPFDMDFSSDTETLRNLIEDEYDRAKNAYVAISLYPIFNKNPTLWSDIHYIRTVPAGITFAESLRCWRDLTCDNHRSDIEKIANLFSITL